MRAIKYKYALCLNITVYDGMVEDAVDQAIEMSKELDIAVLLKNPSNGKEVLIERGWYHDADECVAQLKD